MAVFKQRRGTAAALAAANEIPASGQIIVETDTNRIKIGDGVTRYNALPYSPSVPSENVPGLQAALDSKASVNHTHSSAEITDFAAAVIATAPPTTNASLLTSGTLADARLSTNVVLTNDSRLTDSRSPTAHASTHGSGGSDPISINADQITAGTVATARLPAYGQITTAGAIGSSPNLPVRTGASGVLTTGQFGSTAGTFCAGDDARLSNARTPTAHTHTVSDVTGLQAALDGKQAAGTYATLVGGTVPASQLPSYVDDVLEFAALANFPATGEVGKIYVTTGNNRTYRWSGSAYVEISASPGSTDAVPEGATNLYHTTARAAAAAPVQSVAGRSGAVVLARGDVGLGNVPNVDATARANHTGTQAATTITGLATVATTGNYSDLSGRPTLGTAASAATTDFAAANHTHPLSALTQSSATTGQVPSWDGTAWVPSTLGGGGYVLPPATTTSLGGVIVGSGISVASGTISLSASGVTAGTYRSVTVQADGRVTSGTNPTTLAGYGITDAASSTHLHGNIANNGAIGTTSGLIVVTGASGVLTTTSAINLAGGTAAAPAITSTTGTSDTGLLFPAADSVAISTAGTQRLVVDSAGILGVGIATPTTLGGTTIHLHGPTGSRVRFTNTTTGTLAADGAEISHDHQILYLWNRESGSIQFGVSGTERARLIDTALIVGRGDGTATTSPITLRGPAKTGTDAVGDSLTIAGGNGTGTGGGGAIVFQTAAPSTTSGATANTLATSLTLRPAGAVNVTPRAALTTGAAGDVYYDSGSNRLRVHNGTAYADVSTAGHTHTASQLSDSTALGRAILTGNNVYACRAWVRFSNAITTQGGTYTQSGTTLTVTLTNHGFSVGNSVLLDFTSGQVSGNPADQTVSVASVVNENTFTATLTTSGTFSGNVNVSRSTIQSGGNVSSVVRTSLGSYVVNFAAPAPNSDYAAVVSCRHQQGVTFDVSATVEVFDASSVNVLTRAGNGLFDSAVVCVAVFW